MIEVYIINENVFKPFWACVDELDTINHRVMVYTITICWPNHYLSLENSGNVDYGRAVLNVKENL